ncbi:ABC transporter permease [Plantibacter sp. Mn2098]|uniref:ABC transporter permease n=1 Tax=Plantibacter sp. Mn2098 TaxID=3395266 RepID=UPI003BC89274
MTSHRGTLRAHPSILPRIGVRLFGAVVVLWAVATVTFFALRLIPGDPAQAILGGPGSEASQEALDRVREQYGLDQPLLVQYLQQLGRLATGDLGVSYAQRTPVAELLGEQLGNTLVLAACSLLLAWLLALVLVVWSSRGGRIAASVGNGIGLLAAALPHFWLATVLISLFSTWLGWLPPVSTGDASGLVLPVLTLAIPVAGFLAQVMSESLLDALSSPFALSARARGESRRGVVFRHALRHAAVPAINLSGWAFGYLISGAVVVETIFARPGLGRTLLAAVTVRDVPVVTGVVLFSALIYIVVTLIADAAAALVDPRDRVREDAR